MGGAILSNMNNDNASDSSFVPDASLTSMCLAEIGDPEVGAQSVGTLLLMGVDAPVNDGADARMEHYTAQGAMYETGIELANLQKGDRSWEDDYNDYRGCLVIDVVGRIVTVIVSSLGRGVSCEQEVSDFLSMFSASERAELLRSLENQLAFADPARLGF